MATERTSTTPGDSLAGHLLIAMPGMADPNFEKTVTYICEHSESGALGLIINRPMAMELGDVLEQLSLDTTDDKITSQPVLRGGPVQTERGFVLHESPREWDATAAIDGTIYVTTSQDILSALAGGDGPARSLVVLGYAGWGAGQLEAEIAANSWLSVPATPQIVFETPFDKRWEESAGILGVDLLNLSSEAGHA